MYLPSNSTVLGSIAPVATIDVSLHTFLGISWVILLPYTLFGIALMVYSQGRLMHGEHSLRNQKFDPRR